MMKIKLFLQFILRNSCLFLYHLIAKHIPDSYPVSSLGFHLRRWLCGKIFASCGERLIIGPKVDFGRGRLLYVEDDVYIGRATQINLNAEVHISNQACIREEVLIYTQDHGSMKTDLVMQEQPYFRAPVFIGEGALVAARAILLKGVSIGRDAVVEVGSVVTKDVPEESTVIGIPAKET